MHINIQNRRADDQENAESIAATAVAVAADVATTAIAAADNVARSKREIDRRLMGELDELKRQMDINTAVTVQIKEILDGFHLAGRIARWVAKWVILIAAVATALHNGWGSFLGFLGLAAKEKTHG